MNLKAEVAVEINCLLGEGPLWDREHGCLRFVDILDKKIYTYRVDGHTHFVDTKGMPGAMVPVSGDHRYLVAQDHGIFLVDPDSGEASELLHPDQRNSGNRYNDGKCDPQGRFWIGSMDHEEEASSGTLFMIKSNLDFEEKIAHTKISNGLAWDMKRNLFYHVDTPTMKIMVYDFDASSGAIRNGRMALEIAEEDGAPDGMTIDTDGNLWIAHFGGGQITCRNPENGAVLERVQLPVNQVTCCVFGGANLTDLYITTASKELSELELKEQPLAGCTFVVKNTGYQGIDTHKFLLKETS